MQTLTINKFYKEYFERLRKEVQEAKTKQQMNDVMGEVYVMINNETNPFISKKWPGTLHRKINVYINGAYEYSTNAYSSCKNARLAVRYETGINLKYITAKYEERR